MKLTKFAHACVLIENAAGGRLIIDPGEFTVLPEDIGKIDVVVYTHMHGDHVNVDHLQKLVAQNPDIAVFGTAETLQLLTSVSCVKQQIDGERTVEIVGFVLTLACFEHAVIWEKSPCQNLSVKVDDYYYYPGDSFKTIQEPMQIVGVPAHAPWLKTSESIAFMRTMKAATIIPVHDGLLNEAGLHIIHNWFRQGADGAPGSLVILTPGQSI